MTVRKLPRPSAARLFCASVIALLLAQNAALAAPQAYEAIDATYDLSTVQDQKLTGLIQALREAVSKTAWSTIDAALAPDFDVLACTPNPTLACMPGAAKTGQLKRRLQPADRLRQGLCCADIPKKEITKRLQEETILGLLDAYLSEETIGFHPMLPQTACLPAFAKYDAGKAAEIAQRADIEPENLRLAAASFPLRAKPDAHAAEIAVVPAGRIVPLVTLGQENLAAGWNAIALPQGGLGFADKVSLNELAPAGICFKKNQKGDWAITFIIQRQDAGP